MATSGTCGIMAESKIKKMRPPIIVEEVTSAMEEVSLADSNASALEEDEDKENMDVLTSPLDPELVNLIDSVGKGKRVVDPKLLLKAVEVVKKYLRDENQDVDKLVKYEGFIPFFVRCLQDGNKNPSLQFNAAWIFEVIVTKGSKANVAAVTDPETVAVTYLVKFLQSNDKTIYEKVISVIVHLAKLESARAQLISQATSLFIPLTKILKGKNPSEQFIQNVAEIVTELILNLTAMRESFKSYKEAKKRGDKGSLGVLTIAQFNNGVGVIMEAGKEDLLPSARLVKHALPAISIILDSKCATETIRRNMLECLTYATTVLDDIKAIVDCGCCPKIASFFSSTIDSKVVSAITATGNIAASGVPALLSFLKCLKGTGGLGNYWKCFKMDLEKSPNVAASIQCFLTGIAEIIHYNANGQGIDLAIDCGIIDSLVQCVRDEEISCQYQHHALAIIQCMLSQLPVQRRDVAASILPSILKHLKSHMYCGMAHKCIRIMEQLIEGNCERRDLAISLGAIPTLLTVLETIRFSPKMTADSVLSSFKFLLSLKPKVPIEHFADVPFALKNFLSDEPISATSHLATVLEVIEQIAAYGGDAIVLITEVDLIQNVISLMEIEDLQQKALNVLTTICKSDRPEHRKELVRAGVLENFEQVLGSSNLEVRKMAFICILAFLTGTNLTAAERQDIKAFEPFVTAELAGNALGTRALARDVLQKMKRIK